MISIRIYEDEMFKPSLFERHDCSNQCGKGQVDQISFEEVEIERVL